MGDTDLRLIFERIRSRATRNTTSRSQHNPITGPEGLTTPGQNQPLSNAIKRADLIDGTCI